MPKLRTLATTDLTGKTVFYRPDYNVPMQDGVIQDDFRITSTFPTLDYLIAQGCKIVIGSHMGRPEGEDPALSLRPVAERLADQYAEHVVRFARQIDHDEVREALKAMQPGDILLLENLRYWKGEEANDPAFVAQLAALAEAYVDDAFAAVHRAHASIAGLAEALPSCAGYLLEKEVENLGGLLEKPASPFVMVMGGAKVSDKIEVIQSLAKVADKLLIGGAMANTFLLAKGEDVGASKVEEDKVDLAKQLMEDLGDKLVLAADFVKDGEGKDFKYLDIGAEAVQQFKDAMAEAKTIFWNGSLGYAEDPKYAKATEEIAGFIGGLKDVTSIVAGGDTVETITKLNLHDKFTFVSTGGGAALELLGGKELPGVKALEGKQATPKTTAAMMGATAAS